MRGKQMRENGMVIRAGIMALLAIALLTLLPVEAKAKASYLDDKGRKKDSGSFFYDQLDADGKMIYRTYLKMAQSGKPKTFKLKKSQFKSKKSFNSMPWVNSVIKDAMEYDHPELFDRIADLYLEKTKNGWIFQYDPRDCFMSGFHYEKARAVLDNWIKSIDPKNKADRYTKVRRIIKLLADKVVYSSELNGVDRLCTYDATIVGPTLFGTAVCGGFANTFKALCDGTGVPCIAVANDSHAWCYVQMEDGKWYGVNPVVAGNEGKFEEGMLEDVLFGREFEKTRAEFDSKKLCISRGDKWEKFKWPKLEKKSYVYRGKEKNFNYGKIAKCKYKHKKEFVYLKQYDGTYLLYDYYGPSTGTLKIPSKYKGKKVTAIWRDVFCYSSFTKIVVPDTVKEIGSQAFSMSKKLKTVVVGKKTKVDRRALNFTKAKLVRR